MTDQAGIENLFFAGSGIFSRDIELYVVHSCPSCGAHWEGEATVTIDGSGFGSFEIDCSACEESGLSCERFFTMEEVHDAQED